VPRTDEANFETGVLYSLVQAVCRKEKGVGCTEESIPELEWQLQEEEKIDCDAAKSQELECAVEKNSANIDELDLSASEGKNVSECGIDAKSELRKVGMFGHHI
jgi:hypothetical protein